MSNCCSALQTQFDSDFARRERERFERRGPIRTTRWLVDALVEAGVEGSTVLDVGAGIGAVTEALLGAGAVRATHVEASSAQSQAARDRASAAGSVDRIRFEVGDFVDLAASLEPAGVVVLDRVICCYPHLDALLAASATRTLRLYGAVYPRDRLSVRMILRLENFWKRLTRSPFRAYVHPVALIESRLRELGLAPRSVRRTFAWEVAVFERR
ncbi:MAG TPA: class I SAM-dependent methyltransferase [Longimicrobiales bacterium]|nr:class I SAM-dependent methyltransferase [Longimicrobiales bacterium]